jgi:hypothetical protein
MTMQPCEVLIEQQVMHELPVRRVVTQMVIAAHTHGETVLETFFSVTEHHTSSAATLAGFKNLRVEGD